MKRRSKLMRHSGCKLRLLDLQLLDVRDVLPDADDTQDVAGRAHVRCRAEQEGHGILWSLPRRCNEHLKVRRGLARKGVGKHSVSLCPTTLQDEAQEFPAHDLILAVPRDLNDSAVPLRHAASAVHPDDGGSGRLENVPQLGSSSDGLRLLPVELGNVLADTHNSHDVAVRTTSRRRVQQDVVLLAAPGIQQQLKVAHDLATQGLVQRFLHSLTVLHIDELLHERPPLDFLAGESADEGNLAVPLVHTAFHVEPKDGSVGRLDQPGQVISHPLGLLHD
mmetsp:Transcript_67360/g.200268  ORF Transcript_67360/g.200268 Transcript_67360/m.200268 type:complete len:278 (-) Transcript_67360:555-1388(-)